MFRSIEIADIIAKLFTMKSGLNVVFFLRSLIRDSHRNEISVEKYLVPIPVLAGSVLIETLKRYGICASALK